MPVFLRSCIEKEDDEKVNETHRKYESMLVDCKLKIKSTNSCPLNALQFSYVLLNIY